MQRCLDAATDLIPINAALDCAGKSNNECCSVAGRFEKFYTFNTPRFCCHAKGGGDAAGGKLKK